jgi:predicted dehydrogenase
MIDKKIGFGTVGFGMIGRTHLIATMGYLAFCDGSLAAVPRALCSRRPDQCSDLPYERIYDNMDDLLSDSQVMVVDICTPNYLHGQAVKAAFKSNKGVYVEKPLSNSLEEAHELMILAKGNGFPNQCALILRFFPLVNRMKDILDSGDVGEIIHFRVCYYHGSYLAPCRPMSWRQRLELSGGGAVIDLGIHILDLIRYLLGDVEKISALSRIVNKQRPDENDKEKLLPNETDECLQALLELKNGAMGTLETSRVSNSALCNEGFEVFGRRGSLFLDFSGTGKLVLSDMNKGAQIVLNGTGPYETGLRQLLPPARQSMGIFTDSHGAAIKNMANWTAGRTPFIGTPSFIEAFKAQELVQVCLDSARQNGQWITLPKSE